MLQNKTILISFLTIILIIGVFNFTPLNKAVKNFFYSCFKPFQEFFWQTGEKISSFFEFLREVKNLRKENEVLKSKISQLLVENLTLRELKKENEQLKKALNISLEEKFELEMAKVIGKDVAQDIFLIDKGKKAGLREKMPVITEEKILIGLVKTVYPDFSKVQLISHPKISFDGKISGKEVYGLVRGEGNYKVIFDLIPKESLIENGDLVISAALGGLFPEGLLIGKITEVKKSDLKSFQTAKIEPAFDITKNKKVFIILSF